MDLHKEIFSKYDNKYNLSYNEFQIFYHLYERGEIQLLNDFKSLYNNDIIIDVINFYNKNKIEILYNEYIEFINDIKKNISIKKFTLFYNLLIDNTLSNIQKIEIHKEDEDNYIIIQDIIKFIDYKKSILDPINNSVINDSVIDPINESVIDPINESVNDSVINDTIINEPLNDSVINEPLNDSIMNKPLNDSRINEPLNDTIINEPLNNTIINEPLNDSIINEPLNNTIINDPLNNTIINEPLNDTIINEPLNDTIINEPLNDSIINDPLNDSIINEPLNDYTENIFDNQNTNLRPNQILAINRTIEQGFKSGIHNQIMGAGKSFIILNTISKHYEITKKNLIYIIMTERSEILSRLFLEYDIKINDYKSELNKNNIKLWKDKNIINMGQFDFVENITKKSKIFREIKSRNKPIIWIINNAFIKTRYNYKKINRDYLGLILVDECHSISGIKNYEMLKWLKYGNNLASPNNRIKSIIGFSATPLRPYKNVDKYITDIYSLQDNKLNIISNYTMIDALKDSIILPFKHIILEQETNITKTEYIKMIYNNYIRDNNDLPYKKGVGWTKRLNEFKTDNEQGIYNIFKKSCNNYNIFQHHSNMKDNNEFQTFCDLENNGILLCVNCCKEGSDIKNLDYAIYLDNVKKRSNIVSLQTSGRVMRIDENKLKKYALILEIIERDEKEEMNIEYLTCNKIYNYYKSILNLSLQEEIKDYDKNIIDNFMNLYKNTHIRQDKKEISIIIDNIECIIKLDVKTIDWILFKKYLDDNINKNDIKEQFNKIIEKIKNLEQFKNPDNDFWLEYDKLDHKLLNIEPDIKNKYLEIWKYNTWYDILNLKKYIRLIDLKILLENKYPYITDITPTLYETLRKYNNIPQRPFEYYRLENINTYNDILVNI
jgi:superfamily II DNA or RNA helicase